MRFINVSLQLSGKEAIAKKGIIRKPVGMSKISLIWAMDKNRLIGSKNTLPWRLPADMQWFRRQTMGKPVLMGRKTFESIGKPLPGRENIVLTRQQGLVFEGCHVVASPAEARATVPDAGEIMVIGGSEIYSLLLPMADRLYCTLIDAEFAGDAWFPDFDLGEWKQLYSEVHEPDAANAYGYQFVIYERIGG